MNMDIIVRLSNPEVRELLFKRVLINRGIQGNHTPMSIVNRMLDKEKDLKDKTIMVMFNLEILEGLYRSGYIDKVTFIADSPVEEKFAKTFYKVHTFQYTEWDDLNKITEDIMAKMNQAPDITFTNPPYNSSMDLKILLALKESKLIKKLVCVHPATWLVDNKGINPLFNEFKNTFDQHTSDLDIFNGNPVFEIELFVPCVITVINLNATYKIKKINWFEDEKWEIDSFNKVTIHGRAWDPLVYNFQEKVKSYISIHGCLEDNLRHSSKVTNRYCIQLAAIRGDVFRRGKHNPTKWMFQDDMYTFVHKTPENNKGIRNNSSIYNGILQVNNNTEQNNLLSYLQTDFARFCLSLLKINQSLIDRGIMKLVPWMDFTRSWTDDELFSELGYHKGHAIREYAKKFLPDYHNIYPKGKTY